MSKCSEGFARKVVDDVSRYRARRVELLTGVVGGYPSWIKDAAVAAMTEADSKDAIVTACERVLLDWEEREGAWHLALCEAA